ncbi:hypothetical protein L596_013212 [Steinernema carpocapsae]|uniref:Uncharacterized protein n=1 Tax=Steinernema carpocapsae TaxID=34508 RepID=A0A4U5NZM7_STECR|nr:hypothetical protein L596_013212 [Steinernema carpocapsae]
MCKQNNDPVLAHPTIWKCAAMGTFAAVNQMNQTSYSMWNKSLEPGCWSCYVYHDGEEEANARTAMGKDAFGEVYVDIVENVEFIADFRIIKRVCLHLTRTFWTL